MFVSTRARPGAPAIFWTDDITLSTSNNLDIIIPSLDDGGPAWGATAESRSGVITKILVLYTGNTDAGAASGLRIGNTASLNAHTSNIPTVSGKAAGDLDSFDQSTFDAEPRIFSTEGYTTIGFRGTGGSGSLKVGVVVSYDYTEWAGFDPQSPA